MQQIQGLIAPASTANYGYLMLPLTTKFYLNKHLNLQVIPKIGTLFNGNIRVSKNEVFTGQTHFKPTDISLSIGFGTENPSGWSFTMRYFYGFKDTFQPVLSYEKFPKNVLQVSFGHTFI
ncbi:MAG: outer membrane beta-barrel protein [Chitinophagales bacterium]